MPTKMACQTSFELHHNFPKLAEEAGFAFNTHRPRVQIDWNKIKLIDIESLVRSRTFSLVEQHIHNILDCVIDLEFDVRILDDGFLKIFRLAQLAVEYLQFCRHYLDRSVIVLREEITNLRQELDFTKNCLKDKEEEIKKIKRKMKQTIRTPLPYGNENIATMILKTLNQNKSDLFASTSQVDTMYYNKCNYCYKVFLNQLYLKSHITRRHENIDNVPQRDSVNNLDDNPVINNEIFELKTKLKQMEDLLDSYHNKNSPDSEKKTNNDKILKDEEPEKVMKDAEVSTINEENILEKIQKWKIEEQQNYNKEMNLLRTQILDIINNKQNQNNSSSGSELKQIEQLQVTIEEQGLEILALKQELQTGNENEAGKRQEIEAQIHYWTKQSEMQSNQFTSLLQKLNEVENEAKEYRAKADSESQKSTQLQRLLEQKMANHNLMNVNKKNEESTTKNERGDETLVEDIIHNKKPVAYENTFKILQQKAQELLNIESMNSSDTSSTSDFRLSTQRGSTNKQITQSAIEIDMVSSKDSVPIVSHNHINNKKIKEKKTKHKLQPTIPSPLAQQTTQIASESPIRVIRAKVTEEVNSRLVSLGVDPLKNRLAKNVFLKQRKLLQGRHEAKSKQFTKRENVLRDILTYIDTSANNSNKHTEINQTKKHMSPKKSPKSFSLSSVFSNVKRKAKTMSLVKSNDNNNHPDISYDNVAKKAIAFLRTPPGSAQSSPNIKGRLRERENSFNSHYEKSKQTTSYDFKIKPQNSQINTDTNLSEEEHTNTSREPSANMINVVKFLDHKHNIKDKINSLGESTNKYKSNDEMTDNNENSSDGIESLIESPPRKAMSEENLTNNKQTKGVLKNASSTSSINKKKVLFDMNAIQVKSVSASPSQSTTEKSEINEQYELGLNNLDTEEWDLSSIENLSLPDPTGEPKKIKILSHQSPKITELKQRIESQLSRRNQTVTTALVGGVDVLGGTLRKGTTSLGGSNTSLGSSILDDSDIDKK